MDNSSDLITLQIQEASIQCSRITLMENSDYFKAMFEGNFVESSKNVIHLNGVEVKAINTILKLLWDKEHIIEEENILSVLQAACMLQFLQIKETCVEQLGHALSVQNCLEIWVHTEHLDLKKLYPKAKLLALLEFATVRDTPYFLELHPQEVVNYLGNINLQCSSEFVIFQTIIKWYCHCTQQNLQVLLKLLHCVNFNGVTTPEIHEMIAYPSIAQHETLINVLKCIAAKKSGSDLSNFEGDCVGLANFLLESKDRNVNGFPCLIANNASESRKSTVFCYDLKSLSFQKLFHLEEQKCENLDGFKLTGYKRSVFLYGGEFLIGKGDWNYEFHIYDVITEKWRKKKLPFPRRHFESAICGKYLYVVGGTGPFRVIQENIFWYDIELEEWGGVKLPCTGRQIKCCPFQGQLLILNINNKCGHVFCPSAKKWTTLEICDTNNVLPFYSKNLTLFSYRNSVFIKEKELFELTVQNGKLVISGELPLAEDLCESATCQVESVLSNNVLYSLNKQMCEETNIPKIFFEMVNIDDMRQNSESYQRTSDEVLSGDDGSFKFDSSLIIFNVFHPNLVKRNDLIFVR